MTGAEAIVFVREHGIVLASARGPVPRLAEVVVGEPIKGSWWAHKKSHQIFAVFQKLSKSPEILVCRLVNGKVTFVHRRLWPALVRAADQFESRQLAQVHQEHTAAGYHVSRDVPFPDWVPREVIKEANRLSEQEARDALCPLVFHQGRPLKPAARKKPPRAA
jgi:hypothetical protein